MKLNGVEKFEKLSNKADTIRNAKVKKIVGKNRYANSEVQKSKQNDNAVSQVRKELNEVDKEISALNQQLDGRIEKFKEDKERAKEYMVKDIKDAMEKIEKNEQSRKQQRKEELALVQPNLWTRIRGKYKEIQSKINQWNENRKAEKAKKRETIKRLTWKKIQNSERFTY